MASSFHWRIGGFGHVSLKRLVCPKSDGNFNGENNHIHDFLGSLFFTPKNTKTIVFYGNYITRKRTFLQDLQENGI